MRARSRAPLFVAIAFAVVGVTALAPSANATIMEEMSLGDMASKASDIVEGEVVSRRVVMRGKMPWTDATVKVSRVHMGAVKRGQLVTIRQPGGEIGTHGLRVSGAANLRRGETVLLFLRPVHGVYVPVGMTQGKYELYKDLAGTWRARRDLSGVSFAQLNPLGKVVIRAEAMSHADVTLSALRVKVLAAVKAVLAERAAAAKVGGVK